MLKIKPAAMAALSLICTACIIAQPATDTLKNRKKGVQFNYVLSWNAGVYTFPKSYPAVDINLPYTSTVEQTGNTEKIMYKARIANYFTKTATVLDVMHLEIQGPKQGADLTIGLSPTYTKDRGGNRGNSTFFLAAGYEWLIPLTKRVDNPFVLKPCISAGIYEFNVGFDSTIDNNGKTIIIAGQTYAPTFIHDSRSGASVEQSSYVQLFYQSTNFVVIPQVTLAHQNKDHTFYYSATAGWVERFAGDGGHVVISQWDDKGNRNGRALVPVTSPYHFSGPMVKAGVGFYFEKERPARKQRRRLNEPGIV